MKFFVPKGMETLATFMYYWMTSGNIHALCFNFWAVFMHKYSYLDVRFGEKDKPNPIHTLLEL